VQVHLFLLDPCVEAVPRLQEILLVRDLKSSAVIALVDMRVFCL
jgi:hypothetical protein